MKKKKNIRGASGSSSSSAPQSAPQHADSIRSVARASILDLISEGEIGGLVNGWKSIFLNETPVQSDTGEFNFNTDGLIYFSCNGAQNQDPISGFSKIEDAHSIGVKVSTSSPYNFAITDDDVTAVRVTIGFPQLSFFDPNSGELGPVAIAANIKMVIDDVEVVNYGLNFTGKSMSRYQLSVLVTLPTSGFTTRSIRVERISADPPDSNTSNLTYVDAVTEIIDGKFRYPNSALVGLFFDSTQFSAPPNRGYEIHGLKIRVPSNTTTNADGSLSYSGTWDGTFRIDWSSNPAWCFYDIITNTRYGLGKDIDPSIVDKWSLYSIGKYCDALVSDGSGGSQPRFSCNLYIQERAEAYKVIQDMASIFRAMIYWAGGSLTAVQDAPSDPVYLYTPANVVDGVFNYVGASLKAKHTVALVSWNDPQDFYRQKVEYVEDSAAIARYGYIETELYAMGCTSRAQANRLGKWLLYTEQNESETVAFKTGLEGAVARPGQIVSVADPVRAGTRLGGRVSAATTTSVTVDSDIDQSLNGAVLYVVLPDGTVEGRGAVSIAGRTITLSSLLSDTPAVGTMWIISTPVVSAQYFRVLAVVETEDGFYEITALSHDPDKFDEIEQNIILEPNSISILSQVPQTPSSVVIIESLYLGSVDVKNKVTVSWDSVQTAASYLVQYRVDGGNWITLNETQSNDVEILDAQPGIYDVSVVAISTFGKRSSPASATKEIFGKLALPSNVSNFSLIPNAGMALLTWDQATDLDVQVGGNVRIRWTPLAVGQMWVNAIDVVDALPGISTSVQAPLLDGTYMAKFYDSSGFQSDTESTITTNVPSGVSLNVVATITESPSFLGSKTNVEATSDGLTISSGTLWDAMSAATVDELPSVDTLDGLFSHGQYLFQNTFDLGGVLSSRVTALIQVTAFGIDSYLDARTLLMDDWSFFDGAIIDDAYATLFMRTTNDDPAGSPTWTLWKPFVVGEYPARGFQFRLDLDTDDDTHNLYVSALALTIDMPDRVSHQAGVTSGSGVHTVTYDYPFYAVPAVSISAFNLSSGDYWTITNSTVSGFDIQFKNASGTGVSRNFDVIAKGYGKKIA